MSNLEGAKVLRGLLMDKPNDCRVSRYFVEAYVKSVCGYSREFWKRINEQAVIDDNFNTNTFCATHVCHCCDQLIKDLETENE